MRAVQHLRSTLPTLVSGVRWSWAGKGIDPRFLLYLAGASLFNFGMSIFFLLYNLLLVKRGFQEDFIGTFTAVNTIAIGP